MKSLGPVELEISFPAKQVIRFDNKVYSYRGRARDRQRRHIFEGDDRLRLDFSDREILELQHERKLELLDHAEAESIQRLAEGRKPLPNFDTVTSEDKAEVDRLMKYIRRWELAGRPARTQANLTPLIREVAYTERDPRPPSTRTLCRKLAVWSVSGGDVASLLPARSCSGSRTDRIHSGHKAEFRDFIEKYYLADDPETVSGAYLLAKNDWDETYGHLPKSERPPFPSIWSAYAAAREIDLFTSDFCRLGKAAAHHRHAPVARGPVATRHNECWEMDHTVIDVIVVDEATALPIGRPTLTIAIDRHSRAIPAFHIGWDAPGIQPVIECLRKGICLKEELVAILPNLRNPWPVCGKPDEIVTDNGAEFRSKALKEICSHLGIEVSRSPVLKAWYRGRIERVIRTVVHTTCHKVPGTTYSDLFHRNKERIPDRVAVCTLAELTAMVTRFIVDIYHVRCHRGLNDSPIRVWNRSVALHGLKPLPDPRKLTVALSLLYFRRTHRQGILFDGLWFTGPQLHIYRTIPGVPKVVNVKVDPNDLTRIWYMDSTVDDYVELPIEKSSRDRVQNVTLDMHKMGRAIQRNNPELLAGEEGLAKAYAMIRRSLEDRVRGRDGLQNKKRAMRVLSKLRAKAAAMHEDATALDSDVEDDVGEDLLGPGNENAIGPEEELAAPGIEAAPDTLADADIEELTPKKRQRQPKPPDRHANRREPKAETDAPSLDPAEDDLQDLDAAMNANLVINKRPGENTND